MLRLLSPTIRLYFVFVVCFAIFFTLNVYIIYGFLIFSILALATSRLRNPIILLCVILISFFGILIGNTIIPYIAKMVCINIDNLNHLTNNIPDPDVDLGIIKGSRLAATVILGYSWLMHNNFTDLNSALRVPRLLNYNQWIHHFLRTIQLCQHITVNARLIILSKDIFRENYFNPTRALLRYVYLFQWYGSFFLLEFPAHLEEIFIPRNSKSGPSEKLLKICLQKGLSVTYSQDAVLSKNTITMSDITFDSGKKHIIVSDDFEGKSTLTRLCCGTLHCIDHKVSITGDLKFEFSGGTLLNPTPEEIYPYMLRVSEDPDENITGLTVRDELLDSSNGDKEVYRNYLSRFLLEDIEDRETDYLSEGQKLRLSIASTFAKGRSFVFLDGCMGQLDEVTRKLVMDYLSEYTLKGNTVVVLDKDNLDCFGKIEQNEYFTKRTYRNGLEPNIEKLLAVKSNPFIEVQNANLTRIKNYTVIKDTSFALSSGTLCVIEGENGSGKTTLLLGLAKLLKPQYGVIHVKGATTISWQNPRYEFFQKTIAETIRFNMNLRGRFQSAEQCSKVFFQFTGFHDVRIETMNYPALRMLSLWLSFVYSDIVLLDEPTKDLGCNMTNLLNTLIHHKRTQGGIVVIASHEANILPEPDKRIRL